MGTRQWCGGLTGLCHPNQTPQHGRVVIQSRSELQAAEESLGPCWYAPHGDEVRQKLQSLVFQHATLWWGGEGGRCWLRRDQHPRTTTNQRNRKRKKIGRRQ